VLECKLIRWVGRAECNKEELINIYKIITGTPERQ
jgi:hypothetical protein